MKQIIDICIKVLYNEHADTPKGCNSNSVGKENEKMVINGREVIRLKPSELMDILEDEENILIYGRSGYGKSTIIKEFAEKMGKKIKVINLATKLPEAIGGIPYATEKEYYVELLSIELKEVFEDDGENWIIFFDEINQASPEVFNTLYGICYPFGADRTWAGHSLAKAQIVAAGNFADGRDGVTYLNELPTPLHNRFFVYELEPSKTDSLNYLAEKWKNIKQVKKYIEAMLSEDINPRDIEQCLKVLAYKKHKGKLLEAKLGPALTTKIFALQKKYEPKDPAKTIEGCRRTYQLFKEFGRINWDKDTVIADEDVLLAKFRDDIGLTDEEIAGIVKGE